MSRLFSRLEKKEHEPDEGMPPATAGWRAETPVDAATPAAFGHGSDSPLPDEERPPATPPVLPGYTISSSLSGLHHSAPPHNAAARPVWPVRVWLASLLLLTGLSLVILALPGRLLPFAAEQAPASAAPAAAPSPASPSAAAPSAGAPAAGTNPPVPPASQVVTATPATRAPRTEPRGPAAAGRKPAPSKSSASPACSEAMLAMNLCSDSSP